MRCLLIVCLFVLVEHRVDGALEKSDLHSGKGCVPGTYYKEDCNFCFCPPTGGVGACTRMLCDGLNIDLKESELPSGKYCLPGSSWKSKCHSCNCNDDGIAVCTLKPCLGDITGALDVTCAPNTTWKNDCNTCWCTKIGVAACTLMACNIDLNEV